MSSVWGPTCDGSDCVVSAVHFPKLEIGDWIMWKDLGAYTTTSAVEFNGIPLAKSFYFMTTAFW